jgi:hypothetical protein
MTLTSANFMLLSNEDIYETSLASVSPEVKPEYQKINK